MIKYIHRQYLANFVLTDSRSIKANWNTVFSLLFRALSILISLVLVPLTIKYVTPTQFGIWITLSSIINWFSFFDLGMGNGLKNKVAESNAVGDFTKSRSYVSTVYAFLSLLSLVIFILLFFLNKFINWYDILNTPDNGDYDLNQLVLIVVAIFCIQFVLQLINVVLTACHEPAKVSFVALISQLIILIVIYALILYTDGSLLYLVLSLAGIPLIVLFAFTIIFFSGSYKHLSPTLKAIKFKDAKSLLGLGGIFFIIQLGQLVLYQTDNIIISKLLGPSSVTTFNICYRLFSVIVIVFTIFINPYWSAFTDAYARKEYEWIKKTFKRLQKIWILSVLFTAVILLISPYLFHLWVGREVNVPFSLSVVVSIYIVVSCWHMMCCYLLNGINKIRLQLYMYIICFIVNIPLCIFMGKWLGIIGVTISNILIFFVMGLIFYIQCEKLLSGKARGIWNK